MSTRLSLMILDTHNLLSDVCGRHEVEEGGRKLK